MNKPLPHDPSPPPPRTRAPAGKPSTRRRSAPTARSATAPASRSSRCTRRSTGCRRRYDADVGFPGQPPYTRGIYATMHRGRTWTQRQLIGLGTPRDYNARLLDILDAGRHRGLADPLQFGVPRLRHGRGATPSCSAPAAWWSTPPTTWTPASTASISRTTSCAMNDPSPFTLLAFMLATAQAARRRLERDQRHVEPERLHLALRRQPHVLPHRAARRAAHAHRPHRVVQRARAALEPDVGGRPAHAAGGRDAGGGDGLHAVAPRCSTPTTASPRGIDARRRSCRASRSSSTSRSRSSRRSPSSAPAAASGRGSRASARRQRPALVALQVPRPDLRRRPHAPAAAQQHRARHRAGDGRHLRRPAVAAHRRLRRGALLPDRSSARASRWPRRTSCARKRTSPT